MKKTAWGLSAMTLSLLLGTIIAVGSLAAMGGQMDTEALTSQPLGLPTILVSCLEPLAILLEVAAVALILRSSRQGSSSTSPGSMWTIPLACTPSCWGSAMPVA
jgi:hypothetical protein